MLRRQLAFLVRLRGDRPVVVTQADPKLSARDRAREILLERAAERWLHEGLLKTEPICLPDPNQQEFQLVLFCIQNDQEPVMLLSVRKHGRRDERGCGM
jgi:hypothetical protein